MNKNKNLISKMEYAEAVAKMEVDFEMSASKLAPIPVASLTMERIAREPVPASLVIDVIA